MVAVVGLDGAGKSTLVREVVRQLLSLGYSARSVGRWDIIDNPAYSSARFLAADITDIRACVADMPSIARLMFLLWQTLVAIFCDESRPLPDEISVVDGYWMKHAASEIAYGLEPRWVESLTAGLPTPDLVVYLRLSPQAAWERKHGELVPYECGMDQSCSESSFLAHQQRIYDQLEMWSYRFCWSVVDASPAAAEVATCVVERLLNSVGARTPSRISMIDAQSARDGGCRE